MSSLQEIRENRLKKLKLLQDKGINPYPVSTRLDATLKAATKDFAKLSKKKEISIAGRVMALRGQGGLVFADLFDGTSKFQVLLKRDELSSDLFNLWSDTVDIGDVVELCGKLFLTKRSEKTLQVKNWRMLAKSLRSLPEKWHGLTDTEERFRKRYLDLLMNEEVRNRFELRSRIVSALRRILDAEGFLEVETSILQELAGGANAEPFKTHHNALDIDLYLRIAPELDLKKLLIGGFPKVYEIGRSFRNEGIDVTHNPEFTTVEWYEAYSDSAKQQIFVEQVLKSIVENVHGKTPVLFDAHELDFGKSFAKATYFELLQRYALIPHPEKATREKLALHAAQLGVKVDSGDTSEKIMDSIYKKAIRPKLIQPTIITEYPKNYIPLAKKKEGSETMVDAFQVVVGGYEIVKAFSELNDPIDQRERFGVQEKNKNAGDREAQPSDEAFLEALEYGMPPAGGLAISIDRLTMLLSNTKNIREVIFFPTLRPRNE
ncbi:MAG TPA: lysine--tRNA ligase [Candidatus Taylorbacteria bacterium]|nr:MAG: Lysine-tRNA ligase [Parcubacteria group bacterium GW2011_GWA2_47_64]KKU97279.1 MAG: Lysine-tRNA ligase [Parcubacteria group bacterium GW2011_GWC2_48_17]HBV01782.1 lysine--tRNA ligase [Candidatus Taylorbacteria bacterium]